MDDQNRLDLSQTATAEPTVDDIYRTLRETTRRFVLYYLLEHRRVPVEDLTDVVTAWTAVQEGRVATPADHEELFVSLVHAHLPQMADSGLISVDDGIVSRASLPTEIREIIEQSHAYETLSAADAVQESIFTVGSDESAAEAAGEQQPIELTSLADAFRAIEQRRIRITIYSSNEETDIDEQFATKNATVNHQSLPGDTDQAFLVFATADGFAGGMSESRLRAFLTPPIYRPWDDEFVHAGYRVLFDLIDETIFTSMSHRQLLAASREIEDRAWRIGDGQLRVSFQSISKLRTQKPVFERLATETALDIHCYADDDTALSTIDDVSIHVTSAPEIRRHWALVYDGGGTDSHKCALVARETDDGFDGFWTYDPSLVDELTAYLEKTYE